MTLQAACVVALLMPAAVHAQADPRVRAQSREDFLEQARAAGTAYLDQEAALLDGFRPIGPELPAMGQHWLNPEFANMGYVDPSRPGFLLYVTINGKPRLGGVGYALALQPGDKIPALPAGTHAWHEHKGSVADEAFAVAHHSTDDPSKFRVVALHVWQALPAPDGFFVAENWNLPFLRNGLDAPPGTNHLAARMLALTHGGARYYAEVIRRETDIDDRSAAEIAQVLAQYAENAAAWVERARSKQPAPITELADAFERMWAEIERRIPEAQRDKLNRLKSVWAPEP